MNCKQGDLAIVVNVPPIEAAKEFLGRIYTCVSLGTSDNGHPAWKVDGNTKTSYGQTVAMIEDMFLKPLDAPLDDEEIIADELIPLCTD